MNNRTEVHYNKIESASNSLVGKRCASQAGGTGFDSRWVQEFFGLENFWIGLETWCTIVLATQV